MLIAGSTEHDNNNFFVMKKTSALNFQDIVVTKLNVYIDNYISVSTFFVKLLCWKITTA